MTRLDSSTINHDTWPIKSPHCHDGPWHVFIAAGDGYVPVVPLRGHDGLDAVGDEVPGLQAVAHPSGPHGYGVADPDGVEPEADHPGLTDPLPDLGGQVHEVHVAGVPLVPDGGDADLGLRHVGVGEADAVEDGLGAPLGLGLGDAGAVEVELRSSTRRRRRRGVDFLLRWLGLDGGADWEVVATATG